MLRQANSSDRATHFILGLAHFEKDQPLLRKRPTSSKLSARMSAMPNQVSAHKRAHTGFTYHPDLCSSPADQASSLKVEDDNFVEVRVR